MRPSHEWGRLSSIPCALRLTSGPDRGEDRNDCEAELARQRREPRGARPAGKPTPELLEGAWIANSSRPEQGGRSRCSEDCADEKAWERRTCEPASREGDVHRGGGDDRDDARPELNPEAESVDPAAIGVQPALVHLTPDRRNPKAGDAELDYECRAKERREEVEPPLGVRPGRGADGRRAQEPQQHAYRGTAQD